MHARLCVGDASARRIVDYKLSANAFNAFAAKRPRECDVIRCRPSPIGQLNTNYHNVECASLTHCKPAVEPVGKHEHDGGTKKPDREMRLRVNRTLIWRDGWMLKRQQNRPTQTTISAQRRRMNFITREGSSDGLVDSAQQHEMRVCVLAIVCDSECYIYIHMYEYYEYALIAMDDGVCFDHVSDVLRRWWR